MRKKISLFYMLLILSVHGQTKKEKYLDYNFNEIARDSFYLKKNDNYNLSLKYETDSTYLNVLYKRKKNGNLSEKAFLELKQYIKNISNRQIKTDATIIINYLSKNPDITVNSRFSNWNIFNDGLRRKIKKYENTFHIWINNPDQKNLKYYQNHKVNWVADKDRFIEKLFFPHNFNYGSFVIIDKKGYYIKYFGEYGKNHVLQFLSEIKNK